MANWNNLKWLKPQFWTGPTGKVSGDQGLFRKGITLDKYATLKLKPFPRNTNHGIQVDKENEFIEPYSEDHTVYVVFKSQRNRSVLPWTCATGKRHGTRTLNEQVNRTNESPPVRVVIWKYDWLNPVTAEYSNYFSATSSAGLAL